MQAEGQQGRESCCGCHNLYSRFRLKGGKEMKKRVLRFCVAIAVLGIAAMALASSVFAQNYIILYKQNAVASDAAATVKNAGGSMIAAYPQIGVVIARSDSSSFGT